VPLHSIQPQPDAILRIWHGQPRNEPAERPHQVRNALAGDRADRDSLDLAVAPEARLGDPRRRLPQRRAGLGQIRPGDCQHPGADAERVDRREMFGGLRHPAAIRRDHEHHRRRRSGAREHGGHEALMAGHVDERDLLARRQRRPGEAQIECHTATLFLLPPVRLHPGERAHQRRLPVVDVTGGRHDVHG
jgi:hypothetical protein